MKTQVFGPGKTFNVSAPNLSLRRSKCTAIFEQSGFLGMTPSTEQRVGQVTTFDGYNTARTEPIPLSPLKGHHMSMGGDFHAITNTDLEGLLAGDLDFDAYFAKGLDQRPVECFSGGEHLWFELTQLLEPENGCGANVSDLAPMGGTYSGPGEALATWKALSSLDRDELNQRFAHLETGVGFEECFVVVKDLTQFYERAARAGNAVFFIVG